MSTNYIGENIGGSFIDPVQNYEIPPLGPIATALAVHLSEKMVASDIKRLESVTDDLFRHVPIYDGVLTQVSSIALIGKVQSGKTTGMAMSIARLADAGVQGFIVLTGTKTNLTDQTVDDLYSNLEVSERTRSWRWRVIQSRDLESESGRSDMEKFLRGASIRREKIEKILITCMKEDDNLGRLLDALKEMRKNAVPLDGIFVLFDDEADQASPDISKKGRAPSKINNLLRQVRDAIGNHVFIPVTATPQALLVQSRDSSVAPDVAILLEPGEKYVGGQELFLESRVSFVRNIPVEDVALLADRSETPPRSLQLALATFLLTSEILRKCSGGSQISSMMVHTTQFTDPHALIRDWVHHITQGWLDSVDAIHEDPFWLEFFREAAKDLDRTSRSRIETCGYSKDGELFYEWVKKSIQLTGSMEFIIRKVSGPDKFTKQDWNNGTQFVLIGGEMLGRGFVVKGLVTTYMSRDVKVGVTRNMDTVQQRARFFGYKRQELDLLRGWFTESVAKEFEEYVAHETFLWDFLGERSHAGKSLKDSLTILLTSQFGRPTRRSAIQKRSHTRGVRVNWFKQEYLFDARLRSNREIFTSWVQQYGAPAQWCTTDARGEMEIKSWTVTAADLLNLLDRWQSVSIDHAALSVYRRALTGSSPDEGILILDMDSKTGRRGVPTGDTMRSLSKDLIPILPEPWKVGDRAKINNLHSGNPGVADRDSYSPEMITVQYFTIRPGDVAIEKAVGALAIHDLSELRGGIFTAIED
jgi:hypothetical protein